MSYYISHSGIKGQKWGVRRFQNPDGSLTEAGKIRYGYYTNADGTKDTKRLQKDAKHDAEEYARAKAYYGEGAGTRRKKIKNLISERMKDPDYKAEFDRVFKSQNMAEHQKAANRERHFQDAKNTAVKTGRGLKNLLLGVGTTSVLALGLYALIKKTGADKKIADLGQRTYNSINSSYQQRKAQSQPGNYGGYNWNASVRPNQNGSYNPYARIDYLRYKQR